MFGKIKKRKPWHYAVPTIAIFVFILHLALPDGLGQFLATGAGSQNKNFGLWAGTLDGEPATAQVFTPSSIFVGDIIRFGTHEWRVLDVRNSKALIITENIIGFHASRYPSKGATWETSEIRKLLNNDFLDTFSVSDRARIRETTVINENNQWFGTCGGYDTADKIFLLSIEEVVRYFGDSGQLQNRPNRATFWIIDRYNTARVARNTAGIASRWWLRSPGFEEEPAARVNEHGSIIMDGSFVLWGNGSHGVRPALWLDLDS